MEYSKSFKDLLNAQHLDGYIGHGNPNAKILILGQEPAHDFGSENYMREIAGNQAQWLDMVGRNVGYESISFDEEQQEFIPLWPWANQRFAVRTEIRKTNDGDKRTIIRGDHGTAKTWYNYQKLIYGILKRELVKNGKLDFHKYSFHTDMSARASKKHSEIDKVAAKESVEKRAEKLFSTEFFRQFPIVIAPVGHFPRDIYGDNYFHAAFCVEYRPGQSKDWINVNIREDGDYPQILIHSRQIAYASNKYIEEIANIARSFAEKQKINLESIQV